MPSPAKGSIHLGRMAGVDLYLHWSWFVVALFEIQSRNGRYSSVLWNILEYVSLFSIVLLHEFGHAMACRSVGGEANRILLWPFGGVAYVSPPERPGATLWSIAAGPLVNVALLPLLWLAFAFVKVDGWALSAHDPYIFIRSVLVIDAVLLIFNMLPIYPLDGGQILRALLWFLMGRGRSLMVATILGLIGIAGFFVFAFWSGSMWTVAMGVFLLLNCWGGLQRARQMLRMARLPRRPGYACPSCRNNPPLGPFWKCQNCEQTFDTFETGAVCPDCGLRYETTSCPDCGHSNPIESWTATPAAIPGILSSSTHPAP